MKKVLALTTAACALAAAGFAFAGITAGKTVSIKSTAFAPKTVTIAGGDTVTWKNVDTVNHQVVANSGAFASGQIAPNRTYAKRIDTPGTYNYHDALHPTMKGAVKVTGAAPSVSIAASTGIAVYGSEIHVGGAISPAAVGDTVSVYAQPFGQASFVNIADVQTTTNGVWDFVTTPQLPPRTRRRGRARRAPSSWSPSSHAFGSRVPPAGSSLALSPRSTAATGCTCSG